MNWSTKLGIVLSIFALGVSIAALFAPYVWPRLPVWLTRGGIILGLVTIVSSLLSLLLIPNEIKPDVSLKFLTAEAPDLQIVNNADAAATNVKWMVLAFNLTQFEQQRQPLPIPAETFDFLTGKNSSMPANIFERDPVKSLIKKGDHIFGSASVNCPACARGRTYVFDILWGSKGWYGEAPDMTNGNVLVPANINVLDNYVADAIKMIVKDNRIEIGPR